MLGRIFLFITVASLTELFLLVKLAQLTSFGVTLLVVLVTAGIGAWLLRREGGRTIVRVQSELSAGRVPGDALVDGLAIGIAGAFLITPGILSDAAGILLLLPPVRNVIKALLLVRFARWAENGNLRVMQFGAQTVRVDPGFDGARRNGGFDGARRNGGFGGPMSDGIIDGDALSEAPPERESLR